MSYVAKFSGRSKSSVTLISVTDVKNMPDSNVWNTLKKDYQNPNFEPIEKMVVVLLNAILTSNRVCFLLSRPLFESLLKMDSCIDRKTINGKEFGRLKDGLIDSGLLKMVRPPESFPSKAGVYEVVDLEIRSFIENKIGSERVLGQVRSATEYYDNNTNIKANVKINNQPIVKTSSTSSSTSPLVESSTSSVEDRTNSIDCIRLYKKKKKIYNNLLLKEENLKTSESKNNMEKRSQEDAIETSIRNQLKNLDPTYFKKVATQFKAYLGNEQVYQSTFLTKSLTNSNGFVSKKDIDTSLSDRNVLENATYEVILASINKFKSRINSPDDKTNLNKKVSECFKPLIDKCIPIPAESINLIINNRFWDIESKPNINRMVDIARSTIHELDKISSKKILSLKLDS